MTNIYILKLKHGKYYIGKTDDLERRKQQHKWHSLFLDKKTSTNFSRANYT